MGGNFVKKIENFVEKSVFYVFYCLVWIFWPLKLFKDEMVRRDPHASGKFFSALTLSAFILFMVWSTTSLHQQDVRFQDFWNQYSQAAK